MYGDPSSTWTGKAGGGVAMVDVTAALEGCVSNNEINETAGTGWYNAVLNNGVDPVPNKTKQLQVTYTLGTQKGFQTFVEDAPIKINVS